MSSNTLPSERDLIIRMMRRSLIQLGAYVRLSLRARYNVKEGVNLDYQGLCYTASEMMEQKITEFSQEYRRNHGEESYQRLFGEEWTTKIAHGELKHSSRIPSTYWSLEHTYLVFRTYYASFWIDLTCQQFQWLDPSIPDFAVRSTPLPWIYSDDKNPRFSIRGFYGWLNRIHIIYGKEKRKDTLIGFFQFEVHGWFCDCKRLLQRKKTPIPPWIQKE